MSIEFPFAKVTDVDIVFGGIPNYDQVLAACPEDFYRDNRYSDIAVKWLSQGLDPAKDMAGLVIRAAATEDAVDQRRYVETWIGSYEPRYQDKVAVCGWLLSLMLVPEEEVSTAGD